MFTGLIQARGEVIALSTGRESMVMKFDAGRLATEVEVGDSIAVDGVCLTVTAVTNREVSVDVMLQTLKMTSIKDLKIHEVLNLELAMRPTDRLGGHIVQGHIDGVGTVISREPGDKWERLKIRVPKGLMKYVVAQGSITINGVSLTVGSIDDSEESIVLWLIPETLTETNLGQTEVGDLVNIEVDVLAKYVDRLMQKRDIS